MRLVLLLLFLFLSLSLSLSHSPAITQTSFAEWPMAGHDPQRTSFEPIPLSGVANKPLWNKRIDPYISSKNPIITLLGNSQRPDLVFVPTTTGVIALRADNGVEYWSYPTNMPVGHSPTIVNEVLYVSVFDKTIHAVNVNTGIKIWQTAKAGAGFDTSPLVANGQVYAGNRDGYFYAFNLSDGSLKWYYKTGGPISFSSAISTDNQTLYFASNDSHVYALNANTGSLVWKSVKLPGDGFYSFWPVINGNFVLIAGTNNYERLEQINKLEAFGASPTDGELVGPLDSQGRMDAQRFTDYLKANPQRRTFFVLNRTTGVEVNEFAPILWLGSWGGNRYPPIIGPNGIVYVHTVWMHKNDFLKGRVAGWEIGTPYLRPYPSATSGLDSNDELGAVSVIGSNIYYNHKEDQYGDVFSLTSGSTFFWNTSSNEAAFPNYHAGWENRKYGGISSNGYGTHGSINPAVPLRNKVFFHMSNTVFAFGI